MRTTTGLVEETNVVEGQFEVYPNPAGDEISVDLMVMNQDQITIRLISADGKNVKELWSGTLNQGFNSIKMDLESYTIADGVYLMEVRQGNDSNYKSIVISN